MANAGDMMSKGDLLLLSVIVGAFKRALGSSNWKLVGVKHKSTFSRHRYLETSLKVWRW